MLAVALWRRPRAGGGGARPLAAFTLVSLLWFVPLLAATGGPRGLSAYQCKQAAYVAAHDATASRGGAATSPWPAAS